MCLYISCSIISIWCSLSRKFSQNVGHFDWNWTCSKGMTLYFIFGGGIFIHLPSWLPTSLNKSNIGFCAKEILNVFRVWEKLSMRVRDASDNWSNWWMSAGGVLVWYGKVWGSLWWSSSIQTKDAVNGWRRQQISIIVT